MNGDSLWEEKEVPGCFQGFRFSYKLKRHVWSMDFVRSLVNACGGNSCSGNEIIFLKKQKMFRAELPNIGSIAGIEGDRKANVIFLPCDRETLKGRKEKFEKILRLLLT